MQITITSRKTGMFDICPICDVVIDNKNVGRILPGKTITFDLDDKHSHNIYCSYIYGKHNLEKSNVICITDAKNHNLILGTVHSKTHISAFKENINTLFTKGFMNVPDIELYENN